MPGTLSIFDIEWITEAICSHLDTTQIYQCTCVSRTWRFAFGPFAWRQFKYSFTTDYPEEYFLYKAQWIRSLQIDINRAALLLNSPPPSCVTNFKELTITAHAHRYAHRQTDGFLPIDKSFSALNLIERNSNLRKLDLECLRELPGYFNPRVLLALSKLESLTHLRLVLGNVDEDGMMQAILEHCPVSVLDLELECNICHRFQDPGPEPEQSLPTSIFTPAFSTTSSREFYGIRRIRITYHRFRRYWQSRDYRADGFQAVVSFLERCRDLEEIIVLKPPKVHRYSFALMVTLAKFCPKLHSISLERKTRGNFPGLSPLFNGRAPRPGTGTGAMVKGRPLVGGSAKSTDTTEEWVGIRNLYINYWFSAETDSQAFPALVHHSGTTLQSIIFEYASRLNSLDIETILLNCSNLRVFKHMHLNESGYHTGATLEGMVSSSKQTWACHDTLVILELPIVDTLCQTIQDHLDKAPEKARLVIELWRMLRGMPKLEMLNISWDFPHLQGDADYDAWRMRYTVAILDANDNRIMGEKDIEWMCLYNLASLSWL
ncbi:hypothetical protein BGX21_003903 [Mortierella sp. AD011]|nr:hypothetical protein BGX20_006139 [Mortierella sp. AD010]KAF9404015.1 hypothetical protein BGX21_003903 [Mortierella sp. AD011]